MPHINRVRVNNVKYNFGTQYYDDFLLRFSGKNTIYDLANGGGKSVLMLLLLQNMLPNCTLDDKQPIEKLFRSGNGNTAIHSLVEWKLDTQYVENGFQYMTTGFCARKGKDSGSEESKGLEIASVEYFNYCIFYRVFNDNDIRNLPLHTGKERVTYNGLKSYLRDLDKKDYSLKIHIFDRKGDYQRFIAGYGIYESEWEIIRGINKTEGHVRTYFETTYRTARKVVEDLFIEEIIQKAFLSRSDGNRDGQEMARMLLDIKDKLIELSKKKDDMNSYDYQIELLQNFAARLKSIAGTFREQDGLAQQTLKAYRTCVKRLEDAAVRREKLQEQIIEQRGEVHELNRLIETAQVQYDEVRLEKSEKETNTLEEACTKLQIIYNRDRDALVLKECGNDYFLYLENQKLYESSLEAAKSLEESHEQILEELGSMSAQMKQYLEEDNALIAEKQQGLGVELNAIEESLQTAKLEEREREKQIAVWESEKERLKREIEEGNVNRKRLQSELPVLLLYQAGSVLASERQELLKIEKKAEDCHIKLKEKEGEMPGVQASLEQHRREYHAFLERLDKLRLFLQEYRQKKEMMDKLVQVYSEKKYDRLKDKLEESYKNQVESGGRLKERISALSCECNNLKNGRPASTTAEAKAVLAYIRRHHGGTAISGMDYLEASSEERKEELLNKYPYLPYALVLDGCFEEVRNNSRMTEIYTGDGILPLIPKEDLEKDISILDEDTVFFLTREKALFISQEKANTRAERLQLIIEEEEKNYRRILENIKVLAEDLEFILLFQKKYQPEQQKMQEEYEHVKYAVRNFEEKERELLAVKDTLIQDTKNIQQELEKLSAHIQELTSEIENLEALEQLNKELKLKEQNVKQLDTNISRSSEKRAKLIASIADLRSEREEKLERKSFYQNQHRKNDEDWLNVYSSYYKKSILPTIWYSKDSLEVVFKGKKEAFESKNADIKDKQKLAQSYRSSADAMLQSIAYRGLTLEELETHYKNGKLWKTHVEELIEEKKRLQSSKEELENIKQKLSEALEIKNQVLGGIIHARRMVEDKYGCYEALSLDESHIDKFIRTNRLHVESLQDQLQKLSAEDRSLESASYALENMREELEQMIASEHVVWEDEKDVLGEEESIKELYKTIRRRFDEVNRENYKRREAFEKDKAGLIEMLQKVGASPLADEIRRSITCPESSLQAKEREEAIESTISYISLEKSRIEKGIEDMQAIKDNFENQCLQNCVNMKQELDRMPNLSRITMDKKVIPIITLKIPYIKEEQYKAAMSAHIDQIVENTDTLPTVQERLKYIRIQLSWKKLFGVIVSDMDAVRLNLYKRERMKEQSRYLRYEEAVGSTGQSQGIYIQFLVAVINYISSIYSRNPDAVDLKKVIFIDNPFGAAKDVYIWEPIFQLLKNNHVQLIVPARGATPALTGKFEVNYILGQKLIGNRQQTVVVDYRSQVEESEIEYTPIQFTQESLPLL